MNKNEIEIKMSENRQALNTELSEEKRNEILKNQSELEVLYRAELSKVETEKVDAPAELEQRASLQNYIRGERLSGVEKELNEELKLAENMIPLSILEQRADVATDVPVGRGPKTQAPIVGRIFKRADASFLGVNMPSVPPGQPSYPVLTAGVSGGIAASGTEIDAEQAALTTTSIEPKRLSTRYLISRESLMRTSGLESSLRNDMRMALNKLLDDQIILGNGTAPNFSGIAGASNFYGSDPSDVDDLGSTINKFLNLVDGESSYEASDISCLISPSLYKFLNSKMTSATGDRSWYNLLQTAGVSLRVSSRVPAVASNIASFLSNDRMKTIAYAPVWSAAELINDPYTNASSGQIALTLVLFSGFSVVRTGFAGSKLKLA